METEGQIATSATYTTDPILYKEVLFTNTERLGLDLGYYISIEVS